MAAASNSKNRITIGILAHVDAGKTTLAEALLYSCGILKTQGRVDKGNSYLDNFELERKRGITIFSKQARFPLPDFDVTLIDTPGHVDFASEAERTLSVLDYAILVISGVDGVQSHTATLFELLKHYKIPTFIFINKMDISLRTHEELNEMLSKNLSDNCVECSEGIDGLLKSESIAGLTENMLEEYLENGAIPLPMLQQEIKARHVFPCFYGSALKNTGLPEFIEALDTLMLPFISDSSDAFRAQVFKITRDTMNNRLTWLKILSGSLKVKDDIFGEKVNQLRLYSGEKFEPCEEALAGDIVAVTGLTTTSAGTEISSDREEAVLVPILSPVMSYKLLLPIGTDIHHTFKQLQELSEELPEISLIISEDTGEIQAQIMGEIQIEILKSLIKTRLNLDVEFGVGTIIYKETVEDISEGVGHFEPLRHYAEAHLKIEPNERGRGIEVFSDVSTDELELNWQRLIMTHVYERRHRGVLTGSLLTDVKITVVGGRAHPKHTEGGDFRQATYRAVRHGLMYNKSVLLEPYYDFCLEVPATQLGKAMNDISRLYGNLKTHNIIGDKAVLYGRCPVSTMHGYAIEVSAYTKGEGKLSVSSGGYDLCHNADEVIEAKCYNPESDLRNTPDSVFCAHGSGFVVPWNQVYDYMHIERKLLPKKTVSTPTAPVAAPQTSTYDSTEKGGHYSYSASTVLDKELAAIFNRTYGSQKSDKPKDVYRPMPEVRKSTAPQHVHVKTEEPVPEYLLVDGYNIIFSWPELNELSKTNLEGARRKLMDILCNYQGFKQMTLILVFDAYKVEGAIEKVEQYHNIHVVYTKEAETADRYIEKTVKELVKKYHVTVATSDATEQIIIWGSGALRMSAKELQAEVDIAGKEINHILSEKETGRRNQLVDALPPEVAEYINSLRIKS